MRKDLKTGMLIGLGLAAVVMAAISLRPSGTVEFRLKQSGGFEAYEPEGEIINAKQEPKKAVKTITIKETPLEPVIASEPEPARNTLIHVVVKGDTLSSISLKYYGDMNQWQKIRDANRELITDVNRLRLGMQLRIPK